MLAKLKEWWPLASSIAVAVFTLSTKMFAQKSQLFLFVRLFRYELFTFTVILFCRFLAKYFVPSTSRWHFPSVVAEGIEAMRGVAKRTTGHFERVAGAALFLSCLFFVGAAAWYAVHTFQFLSNRYEHAARQELLATAVKAEEAQNLLSAVALYKEVIARFPNADLNFLTESKVEELSTRYKHWIDASRIVGVNGRTGMSLTKFDQLLQTCKYVSNTDPCSKMETYLAPVEFVMGKARPPGQSCQAIVSATKHLDYWIFMDPIDRRWLKVGDAASICQTLGIRTGSALNDYLEKRWLVMPIRNWQHLSPPELNADGMM